MAVEFDPAKDAINVAKHGLSLSRADELEGSLVVWDDRFQGEQRYRIYGWLDGAPHCAAAVIRGEQLRVISLRRAHLKEFRRYGR